jgi:spermidine synthase
VPPPIVITEKEGLRLLTFGTGWVQGAMRVAAPDRLELAYAVRMSAWLLFHDPATLAGKHLVTLGLGAGSLTRFAHRSLRMRATAVEIDGAVIDACREHFLLPADGDGLRVVHADAAAFVAQPELRDSIDVLQVDAYDADVQAPVLDSVAFYADCRACLRADGTVAVNLLGAAIDVRASVSRLRAGLRPRAVWQFPPTASGNVVVIAHCGETPSDDLVASRAAQIEARWDLPAAAWAAMARRSGDRPGAQASA